MCVSAALQSWSMYNRSDTTKGMINDVSDSTMPLRDNRLMKLETHCLMRLESIKWYYFPYFLFCSFTYVSVYPLCHPFMEDTRMWWLKSFKLTEIRTGVGFGPHSLLHYHCENTVVLCGNTKDRGLLTVAEQGSTEAQLLQWGELLWGSQK